MLRYAEKYTSFLLKNAVRFISNQNEKTLVELLDSTFRYNPESESTIKLCIHNSGLIIDNNSSLKEFLSGYIEKNIDDFWTESSLVDVTKCIIRFLVFSPDLNTNEEFPPRFFDLMSVKDVLRKEFKEFNDKKIIRIIRRKPEIPLSCHLYDCLDLRKDILNNFDLYQYPEEIERCSNFSFSIFFFRNLVTKKDFEMIIERNLSALTQSPKILAEIFDYCTRTMSFSSKGQVKMMEEKNSREDRFNPKIPISEAKVWDSSLPTIMARHWLAMVTKNWPLTTAIGLDGVKRKPLESWNILLNGSPKDICDVLNLENQESKKSVQLSPADLRILDGIFEKLVYKR